MFDTIEEAAELNSTCAFCGKIKFVPVFDELEQKYSLVRCSSQCEEHCRFDHSNDAVMYQYSLGDKDTVAIVSGWV